MKKFTKLMFVMLALAALGFGCQSETVGPDSGARKAPSIKGALGDPLPVPNPTCGATKSYTLVSLDGSSTINRCFGSSTQGFPSTPCGPNMPEWGTATAMNGSEQFVVNLNSPLSGISLRLPTVQAQLRPSSLVAMVFRLSIRDGASAPSILLWASGKWPACSMRLAPPSPLACSSPS